MCSVLQHLVPWLLSMQNYERERALRTFLVCAQFLLENMEPTKSVRFIHQQIMTILHIKLDVKNNIHYM